MLLFVAAKYCIAKATYTNWLVPQHSKTLLCINFNSNSMLICWDDSFCLDHVCQTNVVCYWFFYHLWSLVVGDNLKIESPPVWKMFFRIEHDDSALYHSDIFANFHFACVWCSSFIAVILGSKMDGISQMKIL